MPRVLLLDLQKWDSKLRSYNPEPGLSTACSSTTNILFLQGVAQKANSHKGDAPAQETGKVWAGGQEVCVRTSCTGD